MVLYDVMTIIVPNTRTCSTHITGLPWLYWQFLTNPDPHQGYDYEIQVGGDNWDAIKSASQAAATSACAFDFSEYID